MIQARRVPPPGLQAADERRRRLLVALLAAGALAVPGVGSGGVFGRVPRPLRGRSVYSVRGGVRVNGRPVTDDTPIGPDAEVETDPGAQLIFVVGRDAFLVRGNARVQLQPDRTDGASAHTLRVRRGGVLSVFGKRRHRIEMPVAQIGIRGTGIYVEAEADQDYVCT